ncbi:MAG: hypothetical protein ACKOE8_07470, partial [Opitutaceae bacterium]
MIPLRRSFRLFLLGVAASMATSIVAAPVRAAAPEAEPVEVVADVDYAGAGNSRQRLDLHLPRKRASVAPLPVIVFVHGGG